jgi:hypothetical protein
MYKSAHPAVTVWQSQSAVLTATAESSMFQGNPMSAPSLKEVNFTCLRGVCGLNDGPLNAAVLD